MKTRVGKPKCQLSGTDGNAFALVGKASKELRKDGQRGKAKEMTDRVFASTSYHEALGIIEEYVEFHRWLDEATPVVKGE